MSCGLRSIAFFEYDTILGRITIEEIDGHITRILPVFDANGGNGRKSETKLIQEAFRQIEAYFHGRLFEFSLPLAPQGTDFMQLVWQALREIPYGKTVSYKEIAVKIGHPKATRAVGMANNRNPIAIVIPCHRVIGSNGQLVGYRYGLENKRQLLDLESRYGKRNPVFFDKRLNDDF